MAKLFAYSIRDSINNKSHSSASNKIGCNPTDKQAYVQLDGQTYPKYLNLHTNKSIDHECLNKAVELKLILLWNTFWGEYGYGFGLGKEDVFLKQKCPVTKCEVTSDRSRINQSHLVITHMIDGIDTPPSYRPPLQRWVFFLYESPYLTSNDFSKYNSFYNLTSTYRDDSDFLTAYEMSASMSWETNDQFNVERDFHLNRTEFAAALISNCGRNSRRLEYIKELQKHIVVDVYGKCGNKKCPEQGDCKQLIAMKYKYYFAFENSICKDYITEKFFSTIKLNIIPVVLGGGKYENYLPKSSFINVFDYKTPKHLADYLNYLDRNKTAYNSYFKWKKHVKFPDIPPAFSPFCDMCIKLHLEDYNGGVKKSIIQDVGPHFWSVASDCQKPDFF